MTELKIQFVMRATNADKRQMAEGEGAVKIAQLAAKRIMLESRLFTLLEVSLLSVGD